MNPLRLVTTAMGFAAALLGIARDDRTLVWIAIGLFGSSLVARIVRKVQQRRQAKTPEPAGPDD